jgi:hypothetical protein
MHLSEYAVFNLLWVRQRTVHHVLELTSITNNFH